MEETFSFPLSCNAQLYVLRPPERIDLDARLLRSTQYRRIISDGEAPAITNCVTAVRYLLKKSAGVALPNVFIGDMPRILIEWCGHVALQVRVKELRAGDLLFFKQDVSNEKHEGKRYISHVAIALGNGQLFHSSRKRSGGAVENVAHLTDFYVASLLKRCVDQPWLFLRYIDPRNERRREECGADLVPFAIRRVSQPPPSDAKDVEPNVSEGVIPSFVK